MEASNIWSILDVMVSDMAQMLKQGIGANSGPAVFADSFLSVFMGMVVFACFFCFFILHVELCMRQVVPFSPGQNGHWILFLLRKTSTECLLPARSFLRFFFFSSHIPCQAFLFFSASFASFSFIWVCLIIIPPSVTPHVSFQSFWGACLQRRSQKRNNINPRITSTVVSRSTHVTMARSITHSLTYVRHALQYRHVSEIHNTRDGNEWYFPLHPPTQHHNPTLPNNVASSADGSPNNVASGVDGSPNNVASSADGSPNNVASGADGSPNNVASSADGSSNNVASGADASNKERHQCPTPPHPTPPPCPKNYESHGVVNSAVSWNNTTIFETYLSWFNRKKLVKQIRVLTNWITGLVENYPT